MTWPQLSGPSPTFDKARRKEAFRRLARILGGGGPDELLPLDEVQRRLRLFEQAYQGMRSIPVDRIVGSVDRSSDYDRHFLPKKSHMKDRWRQVERALPAGDFPPIVVYQVDESYFVVDGHHRVAIAKQRGIDFIDAEVTELRSQYRIPPDVDVGRLILTEQERCFMEESGLARARPEAHIDFTRPHGYPELLEQVKVHGYHLMMKRGEMLSREEIAGDWYDRVYLPAVEGVRREGLSSLFPRAGDADLFLWVQQRRRTLFPERGPVSFEEAVQEARREEGRKLATKARRVAERIGRPVEETPARPLDRRDRHR